MSNQWFRMYAEFATDPKVQMMSEAMQRRLLMLFCLRCCNTLATLHATEIAFALRISEEELAQTKMLFIEKGFIDDTWSILKWDNRQYASDSSTARSRRHRENKRRADATGCNVAATDSATNRNGLEQSRAEQNRTEQNKPPLSPSKKNKLEDIDFESVAACCCSVLGKKRLSTLDHEHLTKWCFTHDFDTVIKPILYDSLQKFMTLNPGKRPSSLAYFAPRIREIA
jgi:hypothetical protein